MKICFLIQRFDKPSSRYRVLQFLPELEAAGFDVEVMETSGKFWQRLKVLKKAQQFPLVFIQKKLFHAFELKWLKAKGAQLFYDFDDAIMFRHKPVPGSYSATRHKEFVSMVNACQKVFAGNHFLEEKVKELSGDAVYLPTVVDLDQHRMKTNWGDLQSITLGWLGSPSTLIYLDQILPALTELSKKYLQIELKVVSSAFPEVNGLPLIKKEWSKEEEEADLHSFDIGLAPLNNDPWCEGKCGLKLLQYMACGLPTVSSPFGGQRDIIEDGKNGFSAKTLDEWQEKCATLIEDVAKRESLGREARKTVEEKFSKKQASQKLIQVLNEVKN